MMSTQQSRARATPSHRDKYLGSGAEVKLRRCNFECTYILGGQKIKYVPVQARLSHYVGTGSNPVFENTESCMLNSEAES